VARSPPDEESAQTSVDEEPKDPEPEEEPTSPQIVDGTKKKNTPEEEQRRLKITWINPTNLEDAVDDATSKRQHVRTTHHYDKRIVRSRHDSNGIVVHVPRAYRNGC
jgi:hypothetical protein